MSQGSQKNEMGPFSLDSFYRSSLLQKWNALRESASNHSRKFPHSVTTFISLWKIPIVTFTNELIHKHPTPPVVVAAVQRVAMLSGNIASRSSRFLAT